MTFDAEFLTPAAAKQLRGLALRLVYVNHQRQGKRLNSTLIWGVLQREGYEFTKDNVLYVLQDLRDRGYVRYESMDDSTQPPREFIFEIEITAAGTNFMSGYKPDPMVQRD